MQNLWNNLIKMNFDFNSDYIKAVSIVGLFFLAIIVLAYIRKYFVKSTLDGVMLGMFFGFMLTLILEGFLLIAGKTAMTEVLGWKNVPKPLSTILDLGRERLKTILFSDTDEKSTEKIIFVYQSLNPSEQVKFKKLICAP